MKREQYGPPEQRVLLTEMRAGGEDFKLGRMLSRHTGAAAYILSRQAAELLLRQTCFDLPVDHLLFNPNNSKLFASLLPRQLVPAIARQEAFVGEKLISKIPARDCAPSGLTYVRRELVRFAYDLKLIPGSWSPWARREIRVTVRMDD